MEPGALLHHKPARLYYSLVIWQIQPKNVVETADDPEPGRAKGEGVAKDQPHDR